MTRYIPLLRPAGFGTLPRGVGWRYTEAPAMPGLANRLDLPRSAYTFGVIETDRVLTAAEAEHFDLRHMSSEKAE